MKTINYEEWVEKYKPIKNTITENSSYDETMFETFGDDLNFIKSQSNNNIWTLLSLSDEESWIIPSYHWVDRIGYFITEIPWESEDIQVNDNEMCTVEEAIDYCVNFAKEHLKINLDRYNVNTYFQNNLDKTFNNEMSIGRAKYTAMGYCEDALNMESDNFDDEIHNYYSQLK